MSLRRWGRRSERGATLVEFAFVLPIFVLLLFAIIDFGWLFAQFLDVKQGAREGARLAIVNDCAGSGLTCSDDLVRKICSRTSDLDDPDTTVTLRASGGTVEVIVDYPARSLTGMMSSFINNRTLTAEVEMRQEKPPSWTGGSFGCPT